MTAADGPRPQVFLSYRRTSDTTVRLLVEQLRARLPDTEVFLDAELFNPTDVTRIVTQVVQAQPRRDWRTDVALVVAILSLVVAWLAYQQDRAQYAQPDPPPSPPVVVQQQPDPGEIDRRVDERVDERLREIEQQCQAEHDSGGHDRRGDAG